MARTKLVSRRNYDNKQPQFPAVQVPAAVQNPPQHIRNKNTLNIREIDSSRSRRTHFLHHFFTSFETIFWLIRDFFIKYEGKTNALFVS